MQGWLKRLLVPVFVLSLAVAGCSTKPASNQAHSNQAKENEQTAGPGIQPAKKDDSPDESGYKHQKDFYTHQILNGKTGITPEVILFFHDYFSKNSRELRLLPVFSPDRAPGWSELNDFLVANIDEWPDDLLLTGEQFEKYMKRYFVDARYTPSWYGPQYKDGKYVFSGGFDTHGMIIYEVTGLEKGQTIDGKDKWKAHIKGYYLHELDSDPADKGHSENGKIVWAELAKEENKGLTYWEMLDNLVPNPGPILKADTDWTIEFMVNDPMENIYFTYLSCIRGPDKE